MKLFPSFTFNRMPGKSLTDIEEAGGRADRFKQGKYTEE
jgi:hypothetical protein